MAIASYLAGLGASPGSLVLKTGNYFRPDPKEFYLNPNLHNRKVGAVTNCYTPSAHNFVS